MAAPTPRERAVYACVATAVSVWIAWAPWLPAPDSLRPAEAWVERLDDGSGNALLRSRQAETLVCPHRGWPGSWKCDQAALAAAHAAGRPVQVRHDGERVYHAQDGERIILSSEGSTSTRLIAAFLALVFGGILAMQLANLRSAPHSNPGTHE